MRASRVVLSMFALAAIVIAAPLGAHRMLDQATDLVAYDDDPEVPATADAHDVPTVSLIRPYEVVDLEHGGRGSPKFADTLSFAPKTSPPSR